MPPYALNDTRSSPKRWKRKSEDFAFLFVGVYIHIYLCVCIYKYIHIHTHTYIHRERERESTLFIGAPGVRSIEEPFSGSSASRDHRHGGRLRSTPPATGGAPPPRHLKSGNCWDFHAEILEGSLPNPGKLQWYYPLTTGMEATTVDCCLPWQISYWT